MNFGWVWDLSSTQPLTSLIPSTPHLSHPLDAPKGALHYSAMYGRKQLSKLLLIAGSNKYARNFALKEPADLAKKNRQTVTAEQILLYRHSSSIDRDKVRLVDEATV